MYLYDILQRKGESVHTVDPDASCDDAVGLLVRYNIGSLLVCKRGDCSGRVLGIITERDILRAQAAHQAALDKLSVGSVMSTDLVTSKPDDHILVAMRLMTEHRIRHLPVIDGQKLCGIVSIGDIVKIHHDFLEMENFFMRSYIQGEGAEVATPLS